MKLVTRLLALIASLVATATSARAVELTCRPPHTSVGQEAVEDIASTSVHHKSAGWLVLHKLTNGLIIERSEEYNLEDTSSKTETSWTGIDRRNPNLKMKGTILEDDAGGSPLYLEDLYDVKSDVIIRRTTSVCEGPANPDIVPLELNRYGGFLVDTVINGVVNARMVLDTGSTGVVISQAVADLLRRNGSLVEEDILGQGRATFADGSITNGTIVRLRSVSVGSKIAYNVGASILPGEGDMLLGQSFLQRFGSWSIDNRNRQLVFGQ